MAKLKRKKDGSRELVLTCPLCGSKGNYEINLRSGLHSCWACGYGGRLSQDKLPPQVGDNPGSDLSLTGDRRVAGASPDLVMDFPSYVLKEWEKRGLDEAHIRRNYRPSWDGERIVWPVFGGEPWRRGVFPWQQPKVLYSTGSRGLLIPTALRGKDAVLVEGDYKAVGIPSPWVGVAIGGTSLSAYQRTLLQTCGLRSVLLVLDGGKESEAIKAHEELRKTTLLLGPTPIVPSPLLLPPGKGPDDVPRAHLLAILRFLTPR